MTSLGRFITIEGVEGAGKSTALQFISEYFSSIKKEVVFTREPGGTALAEEIRKVLLHPLANEKMSPQAELLLMFAARAQHIHQQILPALQAGKWVVSDRYIDASYAYQGGGRQIDIEEIKSLDKMVVGKLYPDLTLLLDLPADLGLLRTEERASEKDRIEQERVEFFMRVREVYLERAKQDPKRIKVIDAALALPLVHQQIYRALHQFTQHA